MKLEDLKGKKVTIMGLGLHGGGIGTVRFFSEAGAKITVTDLKSKEELQPSLEKLKDLKNINYVLGQHRPEDFTNTDMVVKTPPAPWSNKYVKLALEKNIPVEIDSSIFFKFCRNPIIGVTGTKGKTTTAMLIYEILKTAGKNPVKVGIGQVSVLDKLKELKNDSVVIFELSSWRLSALGRSNISPKIAVITNIYPDHLNYYRNIETYIRDKKFIYSSQKADDFCVINWDDGTLNKLEGEIKSQLIKFSTRKIQKGKSVFTHAGAIYLNNGIDEKKVAEISELNLKGGHNLWNVLAGIGAAYAAGVDLPEICKSVLEFKNIPHRLEFVKEFSGVKYYNDTAATTPESAIFGINSFQEPVILICGGSDKNLNMAAFAKTIQDKAKGVIFLKGAATDKIIAEIRKILPEIDKDEEFKVVDSMEKAVELARLVADSGDVILLSPGAASFGLFANEFDRGNKFKEAVKNLK
jgi:UDP-N-acetylmuramoylalanine--D-glutamate ligase